MYNRCYDQILDALLNVSYCVASPQLFVAAIQRLRRHCLILALALHARGLSIALAYADILLYVIIVTLRGP